MLMGLRGNWEYAGMRIGEEYSPKGGNEDEEHFRWWGGEW
jgi:hypothetical protein